MNQRESTYHGGIFAKTQADVRKWFRRCVGGETRSRLRGVSDAGRAASEQCDEYGEGRTWMPEHLNRKQSAAGWTNNGVDGVPGGSDPWNFVCKKFAAIKKASYGNNHRNPQH